MDIHGYPKDNHGYPWISTDFHGYPGISIDVHGHTSMDMHGRLFGAFLVYIFKHVLSADSGRL